MPFKPFKVEVIRGAEIESQHTLMASIFARNVSERTSFGDEEQFVFPRSSLKPIQALPLILTKASEHFQLSEEELALACASHRGEDFHIKILENWMKRMELSVTDLECGTHPPAHPESLYQLYRSQNHPTALYNNCSGKHLGMLTTAIHLQEPNKNYVSINHPVQKRINHAIETLCQTTPQSYGIDGCSIPVPFIPLKSLAQGFCEFIDPVNLTSQEADACQQLFIACTKHPLLTAGTGHYCSEIMKETQGQVLLKGGAEGVMIGAIPQLKIGFALKALDGNSRATDLCTSALLNKMGLLPNSSAFLKPQIFNWNQIEVGHLRLSDS